VLRDARQRASADAQESAEQLLAHVERLRSALSEGALTPAVRDAEAALTEALASRTDPAGDGPPVERGVEAVQAGDDVRLQSGARGEVVERLSAGRLLIALGGMRITVEEREIAALLGRAAPRPVAVVRPQASADATARLDLRGARVEDALAALESRIDAVLLSGGERLEIIHGVGTGALRDAVRRRLKYVRCEMLMRLVGME
jgi:DNA mismatch repair protein MutS2